MKFKAILADPAWLYRTWVKNGSTAQKHYDCMTVEDLMAIPVASIADDDCALFMWSTFPTLPDALAVGAAWGFEYKTCAFTWVKRTRTNNHWHMGNGQWTRANAEPVLLFTKGKPQRKSKGVRQVITDDTEVLPIFEHGEAIIHPLMKHSAKPYVVHKRIEDLVSGPYCELFARRKRDGWTCFGNEIDGMDITEALEAAR